jgi:hypothetical protein
VRRFQLLDCFRMHKACGVTSGTERGEVGHALSLQNGLRHDRPRRIASAQEEHVIPGFHVLPLSNGSVLA